MKVSINFMYYTHQISRVLLSTFVKKQCFKSHQCTLILNVYKRMRLIYIVHEIYTYFHIYFKLIISMHWTDKTLDMSASDVFYMTF